MTYSLTLAVLISAPSIWYIIILTRTINMLRAKIKNLETALYAVRESRCKYQGMIESILINPDHRNIMKISKEYNNMKHT